MEYCYVVFMLFLLWNNFKFLLKNLKISFHVSLNGIKLVLFFNGLRFEMEIMFKD